jgi:hypothetical protein
MGEKLLGLARAKKDAKRWKKKGSSMKLHRCNVWIKEGQR